METVNDWTDAPRLKMIERSEFYGDSARVYQYGFYDGFQYRKQEVKELMEQRDEAIELFEHFVRTEKHADSLVDTGMVDNPQLGAYRAMARMSREFLNKVKPQSK